MRRAWFALAEGGSGGWCGGLVIRGDVHFLARTGVSLSPAASSAWAPRKQPRTRTLTVSPPWAAPGANRAVCPWRWCPITASCRRPGSGWIPAVRRPRPDGLAPRWRVDVACEKSANSLPHPTSRPIPPSPCHAHPPSPATASPGTWVTRAHPSPGSRRPAAMPPVQLPRAPPRRRPRCRHPPSTWPPHTPPWSQTEPARHNRPTRTPRSCRAATRTDVGLRGNGQTCPTVHSGRGQPGRRWQPRRPPETSPPPGQWPLPGRLRRRRQP